jgi:hypothetical protein
MPNPVGCFHSQCICHFLQVSKGQNGLLFASPNPFSMWMLLCMGFKESRMMGHHCPEKAEERKVKNTHEERTKQLFGLTDSFDLKHLILMTHLTARF